MNPVNPFEIFTNPNYIKESEEALIGMFSNRIKESFLKKMRMQIWRDHPEFISYFNFTMTHEDMAAGTLDHNMDFELCRNITSIHRFNCIGLSDHERAQEEKSAGYQAQLGEQAMDQIRIRNYASVFFRKKQIFVGEDWAFFPPSYKLFAICIKANEILGSYQGQYRHLLIGLFNKILASLALIEDGLLDNVYPLARGVVEIYFRFLVLIDHPEALSKHDRFAAYEVEKTATLEDPQAFLMEYQSRFKKPSTKPDYMHFGWVDEIADYHAKVPDSPYSVGGLIKYLETFLDDSSKGYFEMLGHLHQRCHGYTHGSVPNGGYPLLHYIDLMMILANVGRHAFIILKRETGNDGLINGEDILETYEDDLNAITNICGSKSTEMFETFHNYKK